jgi:hypothetical protein
MPRYRIYLAGVVLLAAAVAIAAAPKQMSVTVKETQVRATPSYLGKILATLSYGDRVQVGETRSGWARVIVPPGKGAADKGSVSQGEGWVHLSALTDKKIVLKSGASDVDRAASSGEVALAGKGFNQEVEAQYRADRKLDYSWVDRMETFRVSPEEAAAFLAQGGLSAEGGAK